MGAPVKTAKYLVFLGNILFLMIGAALVGLGIYAITQNVGTAKLFSTTLPVLVIVLGALVMAIAFFGCCGATVESRALLTIYFIIVLILMAAQIGIGVASYIYRNDAATELHTAWINAEDSARNFTQNALDCCGFANSTDYPAYNATCPPSYTSGCLNALVTQVKQKLLIVAIVAIVVVCIQLLGLLFSGCLICYLPSKDEEKQALLKGAYVANRQYA